MLHILSVLLGVGLCAGVLLSALQTVVLPKGGLTRITRFVFAAADRMFIRRHGFAARFGWSSLYAPVSLVLLPLAWASVVTIGFAFIFWGFDAGSFTDSVAVSGSSLFTLGFVKPDATGLVVLTFLEALIGLGLVALLISFLPTVYGAYSEREQGVGLLRPLIGSPPAAIELIRRTYHGGALRSSSVWGAVSMWFAALEQSHTAFPSLCSFPPQLDDESWVVSAGTILDAASLAVSAVDDPTGAHTEFTLVLAHGISAVSRVGVAARLPIVPARPLVEIFFDQSPPAAIHVSRAEFDSALASMAETGLSLRPDVEEAWRLFSLLRASYEEAVLGLAGLTHAPSAPWTSDRAYRVGRPRFFGERPVRFLPT